MILNKNILILEDNHKAVSKILEKLAKLEEDQPFDFSTVILSNFLQVQEFINKNSIIDFDIILLDRDCKLGGSFHVLDIERFGPEKVIAISSVPDYNDEVKKRGVKRVVLKDNGNLESFSAAVIKEVEEMVRSMPITAKSFI